MVTGALCPLTMAVLAAVGDVAAAVVSSQLQAADTTAVVGEEVGAVLGASVCCGCALVGNIFTSVLQF